MAGGQKYWVLQKSYWEKENRSPNLSFSPCRGVFLLTHGQHFVEARGAMKQIGQLFRRRISCLVAWESEEFLQKQPQFRNPWPFFSPGQLP